MSSSKSKRKSFPSTGDIVKMTKYEFDNAGYDIEPIFIKNESQASKEIEFLTSKIQEGVEWDDQVNAIKRGMGLVNGGILEYDVFTSNLGSVGDGLVDGACNLRSALVKVSCLFLSQLSHKLKSRFSLLGDVITPLSRQTSHGTLIIAESCKLAIHQIAKNCQKKSTLFSVINLSKSKASANRQICSDSFILILQFWGQKIIKNNADAFMKTLRLLLTDSQNEVRLTSRIAAKMFAAKFPEFSDVFLASLDPKTKKAVLEAIVPEGTPEPVDSSSPVKSPIKRRAVSPTKEQMVSPHLYQSKKFKMNNDDDRAQSMKLSRLPPPTRFNKTEKHKESSIPVLEKGKKKSKIPTISQEEPASNRIEKYESSSARRGKSAKPSFRPKLERNDPIRRQNNEEENKGSSIPRKKINRDFGSPILVKDKKNKFVSSPPVQKKSKRRSAPQIEEEENIVITKTKKRKSSPIATLQHDEELTEAIFLLQNGNKSSFLEKVDDYLHKSKIKELKSCLSGIFPGLIKCCAGNEIEYANKSINILSRIIQIFPKEFYSNIPSLFEVIFGGVLDITEKNRSDIDSILSILLKHYDHNELLSLSIGQIPSSMLIHFVACILSSKKLDSVKVNAVQRLVKLGISHVNSCREDAKIIITFVAKNNFNVITDLQATLHDAELDLVREIVDELSQETENVVIPQFNYDTQEYCNLILDFVSKFEGNEWISVRNDLYTSINATISLSSLPDDIFGLIKEIFERKGVDSYEIFLRSLIVCEKPKKLINRNSVLKMIAEEASAQSIVQCFIAPCKGDDYDYAFKSLDELKLIIEEHRDKMQSEAKRATELLTYYINSPSLYVRKSVVFLIVTLICLYGEAAEQVTRSLELSKQRLIGIYIDKKRSKLSN